MDDFEAARLAKAFSHPIRIGLLRVLRSRPSISPVEYAGETGEPIGNVSYHVKALLELGIIELSETIPRRGAVEHRYRLNGRRGPIAVGVLDFLTIS